MLGVTHVYWFVLVFIQTSVVLGVLAVLEEEKKLYQAKICARELASRGLLWLPVASRALPCTPVLSRGLQGGRYIYIYI